MTGPRATPAEKDRPVGRETRFEQAARRVQDLPERPDNDTLLRLYALYKQGTEGDNAAPRPGFFDVVGAAKHEAWERLRGTSQADARRRYVDLVGKLGG